MNRKYISSTSLELGLVTSSILQLSVNKNTVNNEEGLWPYEEEVQNISSESILAKYKYYVKEIIEMTKQTTIRNIISVGMEAELNDILVQSCNQKCNMVIIPNSQNVDFKRIKRNYDKTTEIGLLSCGAGAGLAAAFNAPLAGIMFVLEEIHHTFDRTMLVAGLIATVCADFVAKIFFGQSAIFSFTTSTLALRYYWLLALLGILLGLAGAGYNFVMLKMQAFFHRLKKTPKEIRIAFVFVISGILGLTLPQVLAGGHSMIALLEHGKPELSMICILLVVKFLFSAVSFGCGAPGGIFFPLLILGAYIGAIFGNLSIHALSLPNDLLPQFIVISMAGLFAGIVRAPITGIVLITEMTGNMHRMLDIAVVSSIAYIIANLLGSKPIYTSLLENILNKQTELEIKESAEKVLVTYVIPYDSPVCHKKICQIDWQKNTLVASIERDGHTITPKGDTEILPGDLLMVLIGRQYYAADYAAYEKLING